MNEWMNEWMNENGYEFRRYNSPRDLGEDKPMNKGIWYQAGWSGV
jgi:hypothetical protein